MKRCIEYKMFKKKYRHNAPFDEIAWLNTIGKRGWVLTGELTDWSCGGDKRECKGKFWRPK